MVFGWIAASHQLGAASIALGAGLLRTWFGDYQVAFMLSGLLCLLAAGLVVRIGRATLSGARPGTVTPAATPA